MKRGALDKYIPKEGLKKARLEDLPPHPDGLKFEHEEERRSIQRALRGESMLITASAGFGKSTLTDYIIHILRGIHGDEAVQVTASTGVAALRLGEGAMTLHSFAGIQLGKSNRTEERLTPEKCFMKLKPEVKKRWIGTKVLVVDEISMLDEEFFTQVEQLARIVKKNKAVFFGGIQVIMVGDFFQLPPVDGKFVFKADYWEQFIGRSGTMLLKHPYRQTDERFLKMLEKIKVGVIDDEVKAMMKEKETPFSQREGYSPDWTIVTLVPHRRTADGINEHALKSLNKPIHDFKGRYKGSDFYKRRVDNILAPPTLKISEGSRVMLVVNIDVPSGLANGMTGRVINFRNGFPFVAWDNGIEMTMETFTWKFMDDENRIRGEYFHLPLMPANATTIHKSQGLTIPKVRVGLVGVFDLSQIYVALSRVRSLEDIQICDSGRVNYDRIKLNEDVKRWYEALKSN